MPHTAEEHFKMILGLTVADLAAQLATARAASEKLEDELAALKAAVQKQESPRG